MKTTGHLIQQTDNDCFAREWIGGSGTHSSADAFAMCQVNVPELVSSLPSYPSTQTVRWSYFPRNRPVQVDVRHDQRPGLNYIYAVGKTGSPNIAPMSFGTYACRYGTVHRGTQPDDTGLSFCPDTPPGSYGYVPDLTTGCDGDPANDVLEQPGTAASPPPVLGPVVPAGSVLSGGSPPTGPALEAILPSGERWSYGTDMDVLGVEVIPAPTP